MKTLGIELEEEEEVVSAYPSEKLTGGPNDSGLSFLLKSSVSGDSKRPAKA